MSWRQIVSLTSVEKVRLRPKAIKIPFYNFTMAHDSRLSLGARLRVQPWNKTADTALEQDSTQPWSKTAGSALTKFVWFDPNHILLSGALLILA